MRLRTRHPVQRISIPALAAPMAARGHRRRRNRYLRRGRQYDLPLVDAANLIYQVHDGPVNAVPAVHDKGAAFTAAGDVADITWLRRRLVPSSLR